MELLVSALGIGCLSWTLSELRLLARSPGRAAFGAVDPRTGEELDVVFDRRTGARGRRSEDPPSCSVWA